MLDRQPGVLVVLRAWQRVSGSRPSFDRDFQGKPRLCVCVCVFSGEREQPQSGRFERESEQVVAFKRGAKSLTPRKMRAIRDGKVHPGDLFRHGNVASRDAANLCAGYDAV